MELAVARIAWIAAGAAPNLAGAAGVATKGGSSGSVEDRGKRAAAWKRGCVKDTVGFQNEVTQAGRFEMGIQAGRIAAFGQPDAPGCSAEKVEMLIACDLQLCADRGGVVCEQGKESVRGSAREDFEMS